MIFFITLYSSRQLHRRMLIQRKRGADSSISEEVLTKPKCKQTETIPLLVSSAQNTQANTSDGAVVILAFVETVRFLLKDSAKTLSPICPLSFSVDNGTNVSIIKELANEWLDKIEESVSGAPRIYVDNTRDVVKNDNTQWETFGEKESLD